MKSLVLACFLNIILASVEAQQNNLVAIGKIDSIYSHILNEQRKIWVHVPDSTGGNAHAGTKYPVVYLLDGEKNFTSVVGTVDLLSSVNGNKFWPQMMVVGILNTDRTRDLTPTHVASGLWIDSSTGRRSGGGEAFIAFVEKELIPHIDSLYPSSRYRMLIGHSYGGLTVINTLVHHKNLFSSYVAIDPSMWWDKQHLLYETGPVLKSTSYVGTTLFLGMAHTQSPGMDTAMLQIDTTDGTLHPRSILQLSRYIADAGKNGLQTDFKYYDAETHGSIPIIATYDALHFIFKDYQLNYQDSYFTDSAFQLASFLKDHFNNITSKYGITSEDGSTLLPPEDLVNNLGYYVLGKRQFKKAEEMFSMNVTNYPAGFTAYHYLGELYSAKGDKVNAIKSYKKSLSLKENMETRKKLEKLEGK
jgi:uncharacterized protein